MIEIQSKGFSFNNTFGSPNNTTRNNEFKKTLIHFYTLNQNSSIELLKALRNAMVEIKVLEVQRLNEDVMVIKSDRF